MKLFGALLVVLSGAMTGLSAGGSVRRAARLASWTEEMLTRFRSLICLQRLSLPEAVAALHEEYPRAFPEQEEISRTLPVQSFARTWGEIVRRMALPQALESILCSLGRELAAGEEPERCFDAALGELRGFREQSRAREREALRLYPALGLTAGFFLAMLLL